MAEARIVLRLVECAYLFRQEPTLPYSPVPPSLDGGRPAISAALAAGCRVLLLYAHPQPQASRVNRKLAGAARAVPGVVVSDLYETYPDFYIEVARERALVSRAEVLVLVFPLQWYACPALLKEWFDVVLHDAWQVDRVKPTESGARRRCQVVLSTGGAAADFAAGRRHGRPLDDYLAPLAQSARVCGMDWLEPLVLYNAHGVDNAAVEAHVARFTATLEALAGAAPMLCDATVKGDDHGN